MKSVAWGLVEEPGREPRGDCPLLLCLLSQSTGCICKMDGVGLLLRCSEVCGVTVPCSSKAFKIQPRMLLETRKGQQKDK